MDSLRSFFSDLIEWEWIRAHFDPKRVLSLPLSIRAQIGPNPRIIDDVAWAKLIAAGLTLNVEDLHGHGTPAARQVGQRDTDYPIEMVRALVVVWLFGGCRIDEIRRLEVECVIWDEGTDEKTGNHYPICLLRVPQNKTSGPFNKPVDPATFIEVAASVLGIPAGHQALTVSSRWSRHGQQPHIGPELGAEIPLIGNLGLGVAATEGGEASVSARERVAQHARSRAGRLFDRCRALQSRDSFVAG